MPDRSLVTRSMAKPRLVGVLVAVFGVLACLAPSVLLLSGLPALPLVLAWAALYGYGPSVRERWPWWVVGQWASLTTLFVFVLVGEPFEMYLVWAGVVVGTVMTVAWMLPVGLVALHRSSWHTWRPSRDPSSTTRG